MLETIASNPSALALLREIYINGYSRSQDPLLAQMLCSGLVKEIPEGRFVFTSAGLALARRVRGSSPEWEERAERILCVEGSRIRPLILPKGLTVGVEKQIEQIINEEPVLIPRPFAEDPQGPARRHFPEHMTVFAE